MAEVTVELEMGLVVGEKTFKTATIRELTAEIGRASCRERV